MIDFRLVTKVECEPNGNAPVVITQQTEPEEAKHGQDQRREFVNGTVRSIILVKMPLRIIGGTFSDLIVPVANFILSPLLLLLNTEPVPPFEHHGLILEVLTQHNLGTVEYWTTQKYQDGNHGPIRAKAVALVDAGILEVKECGNNPACTHSLTVYYPRSVLKLATVWDYNKNYPQDYNYIKPQHCQTYARNFLTEFC